LFLAALPLAALALCVVGDPEAAGMAPLGASAIHIAAIRSGPRVGGFAHGSDSAEDS
jgi:hypothetical protein